MPHLFGYQEQDAHTKNTEWQEAVMVFQEPVAQCIGTNEESEYYHPVFEERIADNVKAKNG